MMAQPEGGLPNISGLPQHMMGPGQGLPPNMGGGIQNAG